MDDDRPPIVLSEHDSLGPSVSCLERGLSHLWMLVRTNPIPTLFIVGQAAWVAFYVWCLLQ